MDQVHVIESLPAYSLGILDEQDARQVRAHLDGCEICRKELTAYRTVVEQLPLAAVDARPRPAVKDRLFEQIRPAPVRQTPGAWTVLLRFFQRTAPAWAVVSMILLAAMVITNLLLWRQVRELAAAPSEQFHVVQLAGNEIDAQAYAWMVMTPDGRYGTLIVEGLPRLEEGMAYQVWLIRGEERTSGGMFSVGWSGYGAMELHAPDNLASYERVGVTVEPATGSPGPTGPRVLTGDL